MADFHICSGVPQNLCTLAQNVALGYADSSRDTIVSETIRFTNHNQSEAYKNMSSIALRPPAWLIFICENDNGSTISKAKLHNPIENIVKIATNVNCKRVAYSDALVYGFGFF